jgi:membrane-associated protein
MLFTAGLLVATDTIKFNIWLFAALIVVSAIIGNQTGYLIGSKAGPAIFNKPDSRLFKRENVDSAHKFFEKHGGKALILARFVPIIRTFVPVIVGVAQMDKKKFFLYNVIGAFLWGGGVTLLGYLLGDRVPWVRDNLDIIFIAIVLLSVLPGRHGGPPRHDRQAAGRGVRHGPGGRVHRRARRPSPSTRRPATDTRPE